jgi:hypothetical protein
VGGDKDTDEDTVAEKTEDAKPGEVTIAEGRFTIDSEVSQLIGGLGDNRKVQIVRGAKSEVKGFRNGAAEDERAPSDEPAAAPAPAEAPK